MENYTTITDGASLNKIFETALDKLIILMFYTKNNPACRIAKSSFEKSAMNHITSIFCVIDVDKFNGESRFINHNNMPCFDCYYMGNKLGNFAASNDQEIEQIIRTAERYVMTQNNTKNNMNQTQGQNMQMGMGMQSQPQMTALQIQQQIINAAMAQNPAYASQLLSNPMMLQQLVQQQMMRQQMMQQQMMQQQMMQNQMMPNQMMMNQMAGQMPNQMSNQMPNQMPNQMANQMANMMSNMAPSMGGDSNVLPTFQQMQRMFQIWQMMQQMGIINSQTANPANPNGQATPTNAIPETTDPANVIVLPTGDKLIPLPGKQYGLIKKTA